MIIQKIVVSLRKINNKNMENKKIIVLETRGKNDEFDWLTIHLFDTEQGAELFCNNNTDCPMDKKYWRYCEIIKSGKCYEPARYRNYED